MLRENRDFHVIQEIKAAFRQYSFLSYGICILGSSTYQNCSINNLQNKLR